MAPDYNPPREQGRLASDRGSMRDAVINPPESTILSGAQNTRTTCMPHSQLYQDARVYAQVRDWVSQPAATPMIASAP